MNQKVPRVKRVCERCGCEWVGWSYSGCPALCWIPDEEGDEKC